MPTTGRHLTHPKNDAPKREWCVRELDCGQGEWCDILADLIERPFLIASLQDPMLHSRAQPIYSLGSLLVCSGNHPPGLNALLRLPALACLSCSPVLTSTPAQGGRLSARRPLLFRLLAP